MLIHNSGGVVYQLRHKVPLLVEVRSARNVGILERMTEGGVFAVEKHNKEQPNQRDQNRDGQWLAEALL